MFEIGCSSIREQFFIELKNINLGRLYLKRETVQYLLHILNSKRKIFVNLCVKPSLSSPPPLSLYIWNIRRKFANSRAWFIPVQKLCKTSLAIKTFLSANHTCFSLVGNQMPVFRPVCVVNDECLHLGFIIVALLPCKVVHLEVIFGTKYKPGLLLLFS